MNVMRGPTSTAIAPPARPRTGSRMKPWGRRSLRAMLGVGIAIGIWAAITASGTVDTTIFPTVPSFVGALASSWHELLLAIGDTVGTWALGLAAGGFLAVVLGIVVGTSYWADALTDIIVRVLRPLPSLALIPVAVLLLGLDITMAAALVAYATFWPIFVNTRYAARQIEPRLLDSGRALGLTGFNLVRRVILPAIAPGVATGVRVAVGIGIVVTVSVQLVSGIGGLGGYVLTAQTNGLTSEVFVGAAAGGLLGWLLNGLCLGLTRWLLPWQAAMGGRA